MKREELKEEKISLIFDAHCDTLEKLADFGGDLRNNTYHVDLNRLKTGGGHIQVFAAFVDKKKISTTPFERATELIDIYHRELERNKDIALHCTNALEIEAALSQNKIAALLSAEGGEAIEGSLEKLHILYERGVRIMTLTWNYKNEICDGIGEERGGGLTAFGKSVVAEMNNLGMLIDVSHISVRGFWDVMEASSKPILATHSNAKTLCPHPRNLDDEQIKAIIKSKGCIGINFYPLFVAGEDCTVGQIVDHIEYILALGGEDNIGFGGDFDGIDCLPCGTYGTEDTGKVIKEMRRRGFSETVIEKIAYKNLIRAIMNISEMKK